MAVVSLPRAFMFRVNLNDPHPAPWIRVKLSCAMGRALFPDPQWDRLAALWESFYPTDGLAPKVTGHPPSAREGDPRVRRSVDPPSSGGITGPGMGEVMQLEDRQPHRLAACIRPGKRAPALLRRASPTLVFAVIGQARADGRISPELEARVLAGLLTYWALTSNLDTSEICATRQTSSHTLHRVANHSQSNT